MLQVSVACSSPHLLVYLSYDLIQIRDNKNSKVFLNQFDENARYRCPTMKSLGWCGLKSLISKKVCVCVWGGGGGQAHLDSCKRLGKDWGQRLIIIIHCTQL